MFQLEDQVKNVIDSMPLLTKAVAAKLATRAMELMRYACLNSIKGKVEAQSETMEYEGIISFAKGQKKDSCYDKTLRARRHCLRRGDL